MTSEQLRTLIKSSTEKTSSDIINSNYATTTESSHGVNNNGLLNFLNATSAPTASTNLQQLATAGIPYNRTSSDSEFLTMRNVLDQFVKEMATLRAENRSLKEQLNLDRNPNTVSTNSLLNPLMSVPAAPCQIPSDQTSSSTLFQSGTNTILAESAQSQVNSIIPEQQIRSNSNIPTVSRSTSIQLLPLVNQEVSSPLLSNTSATSPLQQWLQNNSYNTLVDQNTNHSSYHNKHLEPLPNFSGDASQWPLFYSSFVNTTREYNYSNLHNNQRLSKALSGEARETVEALLINPNNVEHIIETLEFMYGRPELLLNHILAKIRNLEEVSEDRIQDFINLSIKIKNYTYYLETIRNSQHHLCNPTIIKEIVEKMPLSKRIEWTRASLVLAPYPTLRDLANWMYNEAQLLSLVFSHRSSPIIEKARINVLDSNEEYTVGKVGKSKKIEVVESNSMKKEFYKGTNHVRCRSCKLCDQKHSLFRCPAFKAKSVEDRWKIVKEKRICFACLRAGHSIGTCSWKRTCGINNCKRAHNRYLHFNKLLNKSPPTANVNSQDSNYKENSKQFFKIIPIKIHGKDKIVDEFAFIDEGSSTSLIDLELLSELGLEADQSDKLEVKWFNGSTTLKKTCELDLCISPCHKRNIKYKLSNIKAVKDLQLPAQSMDVSKLSNKYKTIQHLPIAYRNAKPKILISLKHCHLAFPQKAFEVDDLAVIKCKLGWYCYGTIITEDNDDINATDESTKYKTRKKP